MVSLSTDDRGESLLEILVTVVIMGITVVAIIGGMLSAIQMSDVHRKQVTAGTVAQRLAETVTQSAYVNCGTYPVATPAGYTTSVAVRYWNPSWTAGSVSSPWTSTCTPTTDPGVQQVTVHVQTSDGRAGEDAVVVVRRP